MLVYHQAFDLYHCIFRMFQLLISLPPKQYEVDRIKIYDFFLLFPHYIKNTRFPVAARKYRSYFSKLGNKYDTVDIPNQLFLRLNSYQTAALRSLASYEFINAELLKKNKIKLTDREIPEKLKMALASANDHNEETIYLLKEIFTNIPLYGPGGLKDRSGLMEYKFDVT